MTIAKQMLAELETEAITTRKMLSLFPFEKSDYKPHEKSMPMGNLVRHIAEIYGWAKECVQDDELDFAKPNFVPEALTSTEELLALFDKRLAASKEILENTTDEQIAKIWTMRSGETIYFTMPKTQVMRTWVLNHSVHHRAQLGVYLRMLDIAIPGSYWPSADE